MKAPSPIVIEHVYPELDAGRFAVKREVGDRLDVWADIFAEGHDPLAAQVRFRACGEPDWRTSPLRLVDNDRWNGGFALERNGRYEYTIEAWRDESGAERPAATYARILEVIVDRPAARFAAWYELFPRSQGQIPR